MADNTPITVAKGDGIGPEIMDATLHILKEAGARIDIEEIEIGEKVYLRGNSAGIEPRPLRAECRTCGRRWRLSGLRARCSGDVFDSIPPRDRP